MNFQTKRYTQDLRRYYRMPVVQASLTVVLSLFVISVFLIFALRPTIVSIVALKKTIAESKTTIEQLDRKITNLQQASNQLDTDKALLSSVNMTIPNTGAEYSPLVSAVETLANLNGVKIENDSLGSTLLFSHILTPFTPNKDEIVEPLSFSVRVVGGYTNVATFLSQLLSMERLIMVDSVTLAKETSTKTGAVTVSLSLAGKAFYLADDAQLQKSLEIPKGTK